MKFGNGNRVGAFFCERVCAFVLNSHHIGYRMFRSDLPRIALSIFMVVDCLKTKDFCVAISHSIDREVLANS